MVVNASSLVQLKSCEGNKYCCIDDSGEDCCERVTGIYDFTRVQIIKDLATNTTGRVPFASTTAAKTTTTPSVSAHAPTATDNSLRDEIQRTVGRNVGLGIGMMFAFALLLLAAVFFFLRRSRMRRGRNDHHADTPAPACFPLLVRADRDPAITDAGVGHQPKSDSSRPEGAPLLHGRPSSSMFSGPPPPYSEQEPRNTTIPEGLPAR
jgi:hypothetical protein